MTLRIRQGLLSLIAALPLSAFLHIPSALAQTAASSSSAQPGQDLLSTIEQTTRPLQEVTVMDRILIGGGTAVVALVCFFLFVRLLERSFIQQKKDAQLGRHAGISLAILLTSLGMAGLVAIVKHGIWPSEFTLWVVFVAIVWAIHGIYTLVAVRAK